MRAVPEMERELDSRLEDLGYELVEVRWGGAGDVRCSSSASIVRIRCRVRGLRWMSVRR
jgi:hypothetical protein